jgi:hypothetical protein
MAEKEQYRPVGCIDRPGPVAVAGSKITVRGWVAGPVPICEVSLSINGQGIGTAPERETRSDLKKLSYPEANVFSYRFSAVLLLDLIDRDVIVTIDAKLINGQTYPSTKILRVVETVNDALLFINERPDERALSYANLALDLVKSGRFSQATLVIDAARKRFPNDPALEQVTRNRGALAPLCALSANFPSDLFDHSFYTDGPLKRFRETPLDSIQHYLERGARERGDPNPLFDSKWYAERYDLAADVDPIVHYAQHEKDGHVSPNRFWEYVRGMSIVPPPLLSNCLLHYPKIRKPTFINGLYGSGRSYINSLIQKSNLDIAYYFQDREPRYNLPAVPVIRSGHTTSIYKVAGLYPPDYGRALLERAAAHQINFVFIYRHPLDSLLTNWVWFRHLHISKKMTSGITQVYKSEEDFHRELDSNIYEFSLFCGGSKDFTRITKGSEPSSAFLSLLEFVDETEAFMTSPNVQCFRLEDFVSDTAEEFKRLVSIVAPDLIPNLGKVPMPRSSSSHYHSAKKNVSSFRSLIGSLPTDIVRRIEAMGYSV